MKFANTQFDLTRNEIAELSNEVCRHAEREGLTDRFTKGSCLTADGRAAVRTALRLEVGVQPQA